MRGPALLALLPLLFGLASPPVTAEEFLPDALLLDDDGNVLVSSDQWGIAAVSLTDKHYRELAQDDSRKSIVVAVIDTGLDYEHPDLVDANIWFNEKELANGEDDDGNGYVDDLMGWDFINDDNDPWDDVGHGTHVAGIIAATAGNGRGVRGIDSRARIMPLKALNFVGRGLSTRVAQAIYYAVDNGAQVINLSMAVRDFSEHEKKAVGYAKQRGVLVVAASGNDGENAKKYTPAAIDGVLTVAAMDRKNERPGFSNWGEQVDIAAPGVDIVSLRAHGTDFNVRLGDEEAVRGLGMRGPRENYYSASGTSFAAPFVSGAASLLLSTRPNLKAEDVERILLHSAADIAEPGRDGNTGYGRLDIAAALQADSNYFISCEIIGVNVINTGKGPALQVNGTADADKFRSGTLTLGKGSQAEKFERKGLEIKSPVSGGALVDIPVGLLRESTQWTLRLEVQHKSGTTRECRFQVSLG